MRTIHFSYNFLSSMKIMGVSGRFSRFVGVRVGVASSRNKLALRLRLRNLNLKSQISIFDSFRDIHSFLDSFRNIRVHNLRFFEVPW